MLNEPKKWSGIGLNKVGYKHGIAIILGTVAFVAWSWPIIVSLHERWLTSGFEHGYPIVILTLLLLGLTLRKFDVRMGDLGFGGMVVLAICIVIDGIAGAATVVVVPQILYPITILAFCAAVFGRALTRLLATPVLFIYFAIPFWKVAEVLTSSGPSLNEGLRIMTTKVASTLVSLSGIPAYIDGDLIYVSAGIFEVADGCSGRGYFIVGVELALFFGIAFLRTWKYRLALLAVTAGLSLLANWVRVFALILIGHFTDMQSSLIQDHEMFGWFIFVAVPIVMGHIGRRFELQDVAAQSSEVGMLIETSPANLAPAVLAIAALSLGMLLNARIEAAYSRPVSASEVVFPDILEWQKDVPWTGETRPVFTGATSENAIWYRQGQGRVGVYLANYSVQRQGSEAVYFANLPAGDIGVLSGREIVIDELGVKSIRSASESVHTFREFAVVSDKSTRLVWSGATVAGTDASGALQGKLNQIQGVLRGRVDAQVLVLTAECKDTRCDQARASIAGFATHAAPSLYVAAAASSTE